MTESNDSSLFGNNDLYSSKRHYDEFEPFAQALPPSGEPLFPADSKPSNTTFGAATPDDKSYQGQSYGGQSYGSQNPATQLYGAGEPPTPNFGPPRQEMPDFTTPPLVESAPDASPSATSRLNYAPTQLSSYSQGQSQTQTLGEFAVDSNKPVLSEKELVFNRHFAVLMDLMQHGAWPQALEKLQAMRLEYPNVDALEGLIEEAKLKADLMAEWTHKIKGRRLTVGQEWLIRRSIPFLILLVLFVSGTLFYRTYVAPSRQVVAMERQNQALIEEATGLLQVGQIDEALKLYDLVLSRNPSNNAAQQGLVEATRQSKLAVTYDLAIRVANKGNLKRSLSLLQSIKAKAPAFRDIDARLARVTSLLAAEKAYNLAEKSFAQRRWTDAITSYEETQLLASDYQAFRVGQQLIAAYFMAAQKLMTQWPTPEYGAEQIRSFLRNAQELNAQDDKITAYISQLEDYIQGERALNNGNVSQAIEVWRELYDAQPAFFGGFLAEQLYRAYLTYAAELRSTDVDRARELYNLAAAMPVGDSSEARNQLQSLGAVVPAAQPTPTPQPTVAFIAPVAVAAAAPVATATPEPTPAPANTYQGWIAFRSTRDGSEQIYIMRGDGTEQQVAPEEIRSRLDALYQDERRGPDGRTVFVQSPTGRSDANIYLTSNDGVNTTALTDNNRDEYDPVWSYAGDRIAFVSNNTGNDEIWLMRADGSEARQLTFNNWEWDKHPTWSPDDSQIAFFSNRSGQRQIWVMGSDSSNQRNLSNNGYDDWDPVWIK